MPLAEVIVSGGGKHNAYLMERLQANLAVQFGSDDAPRLLSHEDIGMSSKGKEAQVRVLFSVRSPHSYLPHTPVDLANIFRFPTCRIFSDFRSRFPLADSVLISLFACGKVEKRPNH